jgi:hypothetical protein
LEWQIDQLVAEWKQMGKAAQPGKKRKLKTRRLH